MHSPPRNESSRESSRILDFLRLHLVSLYQPAALDQVLSRHADVATFFSKGVERLVDSDLPRGFRKKCRQRSFAELARQELESCARHQFSVLLRDDSLWPANLREIPLMPLLLFCRGTLDSVLDQRAVAMVGSRYPTPHGLRQARRFARLFAERGVTVVSGLARGIDAASHEAALEAGGRTIGVLGSGLARVYPRENRSLADAVARQGALLSEFPCDAAPLRHHFPQRNRILSALGLGLVVVEAGEKSGSLLTVDWALQQQRPVFVVPGRPEDAEARGGLRLIQSGAQPVLDPEEVFEVLQVLRAEGPIKSVPRAGDGLPSDPFIARLEELFRERDYWHPDALAERLEEDPGALLRKLLRLEAEGAVDRVLGGHYVLRKSP